MDFVQTMKDWRRMCKAQDDDTNRDVCATCPMGEIRDSCVAIYEGDMDYEHVEGVVTRWAKAHPDPVYPTWWKYLCMIGVIPDELGDKTLGEMTVYSLMNTYIQSDTAEKLGLQPKEG